MNEGDRQQHAGEQRTNGEVERWGREGRRGGGRGGVACCGGAPPRQAVNWPPWLVKGLFDHLREPHPRGPGTGGGVLLYISNATEHALYVTGDL